MGKKHLLISMVLFLMFLLTGAEEKKDTQEEKPSPIQLYGFSRVQYTVDWTEGAADGFTIPNARFGLRGAISSRLKYTFVVEMANTSTVNAKLLYDAYLDWKIGERMQLRAGQFKYPFGLEQSTSEAERDTISKSYIVDNLVSPSRDIGIQLGGEIPVGSWSLGMQGAVINGSGTQADENSGKSWVGRMLLHPAKGIQVGASGYSGATGEGTVKKRRLGFEFLLEKGPVLIKAEYMRGWVGGLTQQGFYIIAGWSFLKEIMLLARYEQWDADTDMAGDSVQRTTLGLKYGMSRSILWHLNYELIHETPGVGNDNLGLQFQVRF